MFRWLEASGVQFKVCVLVLVLGVVTTASVAVKAQSTPPTAANFFVGQEPYSMCVEYFTPSISAQKTPIILIHGGEHTGAGYVRTPYLGRCYGRAQNLARSLAAAYDGAFRQFDFS